MPANGRRDLIRCLKVKRFITGLEGQFAEVLGKMWVQLILDDERFHVIVELTNWELQSNLPDFVYHGVPSWMVLWIHSLQTRTMEAQLV